jgi:DNA repair exonuclease SbcCD ATPase subunit
MGGPAVCDPANSNSTSTTGSKPVSGGLKQCWGLEDTPPLDERGTSEQATKFLAAFKATMGGANKCLQYTACNAEKAKHDPYVVERDNLYTSFQAAQNKIDPADESKAKSDIDQVLNTATAYSAKAEQFRQATEKLVNDWQAKEGEFDQAGTQIDELEKWEDKAAPDLRTSHDGIRTAANDRKYEEALKSLNELLPKLKPVYDEYLRQKEAKEKYAPALQALQPRLDQSSACPFKKLEPKSTEIATTKQQMETDAQNKDYVHALQLVNELATNVDAYLVAVKDLEEKKKQYEQALEAVKPKLPTQSEVDYPSLNPLQIELTNLEGQAKTAADAEDFEKALEHTKSLENKLAEYEKQKEELKKKKAEYDQLAQEISGRMPTQSAADYPSLGPLQIDLTNLEGQTKASADTKDYGKAIEHANSLKTKLDEFEKAKQELEAKKAEYEAALKALQPKLPTTCPVNPKLSALDGEITTLKGQMEAAAASKDYAKALELAKQVSAKADEFQKALAEFEKNKQDYEAAVKALQPKLPTTCPVNASLAERHSQIMALKGQMEAAAASQDYAKALELAKQLTAKADEYQKAVKEKPPSPEKVKEVQDLITAGKKDEAIQKAMEYYGVDKSQAKSIVYDSSVSGEAEASSDGSVKVGNKAFSSPGWLASSAAHELEVHVNKQAKASKWYTGKMGTAIQEVQAYDHEIANAHKYDLTEAEIKALKKRRKAYYDQLNADYQKRADEGNYDMKKGEEGL